MKARRQSVILEVIQREPVRSQEQLRHRVRARGFDVTQATLSRDIRELGLVKGGAEGAYRAPGEVAPNGHTARSLLQRMIGEYLTGVRRVQQMIVLRTGPGRAQPLAAAIDGAHLPEIVGTIAGDDTILVIAPDVRRARALVQRFEEPLGGPAS
jgi:transcriptional regulator of arginine metabolism